MQSLGGPARLDLVRNDWSEAMQLRCIDPRCHLTFPVSVSVYGGVSDQLPFDLVKFVLCAVDGPTLALNLLNFRVDASVAGHW